MSLYKLNPFIRYARVHSGHIVWNRDSICYDCRLFFIKSGKGVLIADNKKYEFYENTAIYLPPESAYRLNFCDNASCKMIVLNFDLTDEFSEFEKTLGTANHKNFDKKKIKLSVCGDALSEPLVVTDCTSLSESLNGCTQNFLTHSTFYREKSSALLKLCLLELINKSTHTSVSNKIVNEILSYIHIFYASSDLNNTTIAKRFNYHPYYISTLFKEITGMTLHKYIVNYRVRMAKNALMTTDLDIGTIAFETGFSSASHFTKTFHAICKMTPAKYKATHMLVDI